jgi:DNA processing protein
MTGGRVLRIVGDDDRLARVVWAHLDEPTKGPAAAWVAEHGAVGALRLLLDGALGRGGASAERLHALDLDAALRGLDHFHVRVLVPGDDEWPEGLDDLPVAPLCLFVRGSADLSTLRTTGIAVVGSRSASPYGTQVARRMGADLAERGVTVVSGAAFGIDAAAHEGALSVGGATVAVLACGLDRPYPAAHVGLLRRVAVDGAVVSELPLGHAPFRMRFLSRNRLIAAMTVGTVVVEAGLRSGSLNTAGAARGIERHVAMVPGPVTSALSAGCHEWIRAEGASLVTDAADVLDIMGRMGLHLQDVRRAPARAEDLVEVRDQVLWSAVPVRRGADLATLATASGLTIQATMAALGRLSLLGLVTRHEDTWRKAAVTTPKAPKPP